MSVFYVILAIIITIAIIMLCQSWRKQREWEGTVIEIEEKPAAGIDDLDTKDFVDIYYKTEEGRKGKIHIYRKKFDTMYPGLREGSRLIKQAGKHFPEMTA